ncbi:MAG: hypothetical protein ACI8Z5_000092 [Lentimonas sp.]|jgi:hypothetical protein
MDTALEIDVYDSSSRLTPAFEKSAGKRRLTLTFRKHAASKFKPSKDTKLQYCMARIRDKDTGLERVRLLRKQIDNRNIRGVVAECTEQ